MLQQWFNVAGLGLDFVGVVLLSYEWWIAFKAEQRETEILAREQRLKPPPTVPRPNVPNQPVFDYMNEQMRFTRQMQRIQEARGMRRGWYITALVLICGGFLLQIAGTWPGLGI